MPNEPLAGLNTPNTGDLVGAWGTTAVNANMQAIGGMFAGFVTFSLSAATTIALTGPSGSLTPGAGPTQQQNSLLRFTGAQSGNAVFQFSKPGFYIVDNQCTVPSFVVQLVPAVGTGNVIAVPQGKKTQVFFDGTNMDFVSMPDPGTAYDLHGAGSIPAWINFCTVKPYLLKDGATYSTASFPALAAILGSTFGGNGVTTFGVPDERSRMRIAWDNTGALGRVTVAGSGINGGQLGATGGNELMQSHTHTATSTPNEGSGHAHGYHDPVAGGLPSFNGGNAGSVVGNGTTALATTGMTITTNIATTGSGGSQNMPPTIVSFLPLIKT
jgi:microcystin-dependent protein